MSMRETACRSCGAPIVWIRTPAGKSMPCDAQPKSYKYKPESNTKLVTPEGVVVSCEIVANPEDAHGYGYTPHWSSCNAPDKFRKKGEKTT